MIRHLLHKIPGAHYFLGKKSGCQTIPLQKHGIASKDINRNALKVCNDLEKAGYQAFLVGGAVRDLLIGALPKDYDVATNATPEQVKQQFRRALIIGRRFRLVHVVFGQEIIETSTFRKQHSEEDHTDEQGRILRDNHYGSLEEDAIRRDFTINSLYYQPSSQSIYDFHEGVRDIQQRKIRMIGDAHQRYREDPVRMLRAIRFSAKLSFDIATETAEPIHALQHLLVNVPASRRFDELLKLLSCGRTLVCLDLLVQYQLHTFLLPTLPKILQHPPYRAFLERAFERSDRRIQSGQGISTSFMFAILFWPLVHTLWKKYQTEQLPLEALYSAMDEVCAQQSRVLPIQKRFFIEMREIWLMQPRFEKIQGKAPWKMITQPRFRGACDFLQIRAACDEVDSVLAQWWVEFAQASSDTERDALMHAPQLVTTDTRNKRKRSRRKSVRVQIASSERS